MKFNVYGIENCPDCKAAVRLLGEEGIECEYIDLRSGEAPSRAVFEKMAGHAVRTAPIIIENSDPLNPHFVGGLKDLRKYLNSIQKLILREYQSHKKVHAREMTFGEFLDEIEPSPSSREAKTPREAEGYQVIYNLGSDREYISWSPKKEFDEGYRLVD